MNQKKRGLGRGLDVLLGENKDSKDEGLKILPINELQPGSSQPRGKIEENSIIGLAEAIKSQGILQPILVRKSTNKKFDIIAGERRWRAAQLAGLKEIPVVIKDVDDSSALAMALVENLQRKDLNSIEEAKGIEKLINNFGLTHLDAANALGKSRASVTNLLRLLTSEQEVQYLLEKGSLEQGHVRAILSLKKNNQIKMANAIILGHFSVRQTEKKVKNLLSKEKISDEYKNKNESNYDSKNLEQEISDLLNLQVDIKMKNTNKGQVVISFTMLEELERFLEKIRVEK